MKKLGFLALIAAIVVSVFTFFACNKESDSSNSVNNKKGNPDITIADFEKTMQEGCLAHNKGLDYIHEELTKNIDDNSVMSLTENLTTEFIKKNAFFQSDVDGAILYAHNMFEKIKENEISHEYLWFKENEILLSDSQKSWLNKVDEAITANDELQPMLSQLEEIKQSALNTGSMDDIYIVIVAVEMAKASMSYWYNNHAKWENLVSAKGGFSWKDVGRADVTGVVNGAVTVGVISAVTGPPGWVAGGAGIVGAGLAGSVGEAVGQLWDRFWSKSSSY